ncbi:MAG: hypothetical protein OHK005_21440 [Candidatus Methylacidiphilales bacterium]
MKPTPGQTEALERSLASLLRWGVVLAAVVSVVGGLHYLFHYGAEPIHVRVFVGEPSDLRTVRGIVGLAEENRSRGVIQLGLLLLVAVPVARVALSAVSYLRERDWVFAGITLTVLAGLIFSLLVER